MTSRSTAPVLGIGAYSPTVGPLETQARDAEALASLLRNQFGYEVIPRCDNEATLAGLRTLLHEELPGRVPEGSRLLVYFAGYGVALDGTELEEPQGYFQSRHPPADARAVQGSSSSALPASPGDSSSLPAVVRGTGTSANGIHGLLSLSENSQSVTSRASRLFRSLRTQSSSPTDRMRTQI